MAIRFGPAESPISIGELRKRNLSPLIEFPSLLQLVDTLDGCSFVPDEGNIVNGSRHGSQYGEEDKTISARPFTREGGRSMRDSSFVTVRFWLPEFVGIMIAFG